MEMISIEICLPHSVFFLISGTCTDIQRLHLKKHFFGLRWLSFNVRLFYSSLLLPNVHPPTYYNATCIRFVLSLHVFVLLTTLTIACLLFFFGGGREECV